MFARSDQEKVAALMESIKDIGLQEPVRGLGAWGGAYGGAGVRGRGSLAVLFATCPPQPFVIMCAVGPSFSPPPVGTTGRPPPDRRAGGGWGILRFLWLPPLRGEGWRVGEPKGWRSGVRECKSKDKREKWERTRGGVMGGRDLRAR